MKASGCVGDAFQGMTFRLQRCPVHHHGQYLLLHNSTPKSLQRCSQNKGGISASMRILGIQSLLCGYSQPRIQEGNSCAAFKYKSLSILIAAHDHHHYLYYHDAACSTRAVVTCRQKDVPAAYGHLKYSSNCLIKM